MIKGEDPDYTDFSITFPETHPNIGWFNNFAIMQEYPYLEQGLRAWRFRHNIFNDVCQKQQNIAKSLPQSNFAAPIPRISSVTTRPQHSISENIFRRQLVQLQIFDAGDFPPLVNPDGDVVDVFFNDKLVVSHLILTSFLARVFFISIPRTFRYFSGKN